MTEQEKQQLQNANAATMAAMDINAAGMIQSLLLDLGSNTTYIRLSNAASHEVDYTFIEGTESYVGILADDLGLKVAGNTIEVPNG